MYTFLLIVALSGIFIILGLLHDYVRRGFPQITALIARLEAKVASLEMRVGELEARYEAPQSGASSAETRKTGV